MKKKLIIILSLVILFVLSVILTFIVTKKLTKEKYEQPEIESLYVFGEKVNIEPKKNVYRIFMDSSKVEYNGNGCIPNPYEIKFKNGYEVTQDGEFYSNGSDQAYFYIKASKKGNKVYDENNLPNTDDIEQSSKEISRIEDYDVYIQVVFNKPLEVASECRGN